MTAMAVRPKITKSFATDDDRWQAVADRDRSADGQFVYSVKTTGVYCRPSCAARLARRENVQFHSSSEQAERAGFRACKRCKPKELSASGNLSAAVAKACKLIARSQKPLSLAALADAIGLSP